MATPDTKVILDDHALQVEGNLDLMTTGSSKTLTVQSAGSGSSIHLEADAKITMTAGSATVTLDGSKQQATLQGIKSVKIGAGPPLEMGAVIALSETEISISLGGPMGMSITLGVAGIVLKAVETKLTVGPAGIEYQAPIAKEAAEAAHKVNTTIETQGASATRQLSAGVDMLK